MRGGRVCPGLTSERGALLRSTRGAALLRGDGSAAERDRGWGQPSTFPANPNSPVHHTKAEPLSGTKELSICTRAALGFLSGCSGRSAAAFRKMTSTKKCCKYIHIYT